MFIHTLEKKINNDLTIYKGFWRVKGFDPQSVVRIIYHKDGKVADTIYRPEFKHKLKHFFKTYV